MPTRETPFGAYNFVVDFQDVTDPTSTLGGFSDVTGLSTEIAMIEYRNGNDRENHVRKTTGLFKGGVVTFKRDRRPEELRRLDHRRAHQSGQ